MILDGLLQFTNAANTPPGDTFTTAAAGAPSTNNIDFGIGITNNPGIPTFAQGGGARDMGIGDDPALKLLVEVTSAFTGGTSLQVALAGAPDNGSGSPGTFVVWWTSPVYAAATLTVGARLMDLDFPRPPDGVPVPRFVQLQYTSVGTFAAGGLLRAFIVLDRHDMMYNATNNAIIGGYQPGVVVPN